MTISTANNKFMYGFSISWSKRNARRYVTIYLCKQTCDSPKSSPKSDQKIIDQDELMCQRRRSKYKTIAWKQHLPKGKSRKIIREILYDKAKSIATLDVRLKSNQN